MTLLPPAGALSEPEETAVEPPAHHYQIIGARAGEALRPIFGGLLALCVRTLALLDAPCRARRNSTRSDRHGRDRSGPGS